MGEIIIRYIDLPLSVNAYTVTDSNNDYNVYINARLGIYEQVKAKKHELDHINKQHFYQNKKAYLCESEID